MKWSLKLGRLWGIDVFLHFTFLLFLAWIGWATWIGAGASAAVEMVLLIVALFTCVLLHEYGHALTARKFGIGTEDITLLPIGGVARLERMPSNPRQELLVAVAGPAVNVVIAAVLLIIMLLRGDRIPTNMTSLNEGGALGVLLAVNVVMILFNMLPAFPMDGGRVLRAVLAMRMPYAKATRAAATVGQGMAILFVIYGMLDGRVMLLFIAIFVWIGASNETEAAEEDSFLTGMRVRDAMLTDYRQLSPEDTAQQVVPLILQGWQAEFPVVFQGQYLGLITTPDVLSSIETGTSHQPVTGFMRQDTIACSPGEDLHEALNRLRSSKLPLIPVIENGLLIGLLNSANVIEAMMIRQALSRRPQPPPLPLPA
jgi:Zn-dependent protease/predicted transcriptional regulator